MNKLIPIAVLLTTIGLQYGQVLPPYKKEQKVNKCEFLKHSVELKSNDTLYKKVCFANFLYKDLSLVCIDTNYFPLFNKAIIRTNYNRTTEEGRNLWLIH